MAVVIRPDGYFEVEYVGPYGGLNVQQPENLIKDTESPALNDVILRNAEIRSRPARAVGLIPAPSNALSATIAALGNSGIAPNGQGALFAVTNSGIYTFNANGQVWTLKSATFASSPGPLSLPNYRVFQGKAFIVNGSQHLASVDSGSAFVLDNAVVAATNVGAQFIDELDNHLLMANTNEGGTVFPQRVRWSASGLPTAWDPAVNINAGFADLIEVPDNITGLMMLGRVGYIFRNNGITEVAPTGRGQAPFDFNHLWASQVGIGNGLYYGIAQYGTVGVFVSQDNVYSIQALQLQAIGGNARDAILADLTSNSSGGVQPMGAIVPTIDFGFSPTQGSSNGLASQFTSYLPYLVYYLVIPIIVGGNAFTRIWVYSFEDNNWSKFTLPQNASVNCRPAVMYLQSFVAGPGFSQQTPVVVYSTSINGAAGTIDTFNSTNFNDPLQGSSYSYRVEDVFPNRVPTVRRVALTYRDLGTATITLTLTGTDDNQTVQTASATVTIGNAVPTNVLMVKLVDIELTAFRPQLTISRAANGGPMSITRATMMGQVETQVTL